MKIIKINAIWCSGCLVMKKVYKQIQEIYPDFEYIELDYDFDSEEVNKYNVGTILPVTIFLKNNTELTRLNGEKTKEELIKVIEEYK